MRKLSRLKCVDQAGACDEHTSCSSRECFRHALAVSAQVFSSQMYFKHALVMEEQIFSSREWSKHALVVNAQAFSSQEFKGMCLWQIHKPSCLEMLRACACGDTEFSHLKTLHQACTLGKTHKTSCRENVPSMRFTW